MNPDRMLSAIRSTIVRITRDIKNKKGNVGSDKINSLARLVNSYNRLVEQSKLENMKIIPRPDPSSENYYEKMEKECLESQRN
jgi:hypothetical protein